MCGLFIHLHSLESVRPMKICDIREKAVKLDVSLRNAAFSLDEMTTSIVAVITDVIREGAPVIGYGFNSTGRYACGAQMRDRFIPRLLKQPPDSLIDQERGNFDPGAAIKAMMTGEKPGGDMERSVGIGTIEVAIWDAMAKIAEKPLHQFIAEWYGLGPATGSMFCYVGGGWYQPGKTVDDLKDEMRAHLDNGYTLVKTKVGGASLREDIERIEAILSIVDDSGSLAVDANCGLTPEQSLSYAAALKPFNLRWFEEPVHPVKFEALANFVGQYENPVATGENLFTIEDQENLLCFGGMRSGSDIVQIDIPQSYGIDQCHRSLTMLERYGWTAESVVPHGGNQMSLAVARGFGMAMCEAYPNVFGVFSGYADDSRVEDGYLITPDRPGIGFEGQTKLFSLFASLHE